jgi:hypothetical protein
VLEHAPLEYAVLEHALKVITRLAAVPSSACGLGGLHHISIVIPLTGIESPELGQAVVLYRTF